ncbi:MAG: hypothetical protein ABIR15_12375 [Chitinophagaceae bacterium]
MLIIGKDTNGVYPGNNWYSLHGGFIIDGFTDFQTWANTKSKEKYNNNIAGCNIDPLFANAGHTTLTDPALIYLYNNYKPVSSSALYKGGLDLKTLFGIDNGSKTLNETAAGAKGIGASY